MTTHDDATPEQSEAREPSFDELLGEVLGLIDQVVTARLADGELARRRNRIKANVDRGPLPPPAPAPACDALPTPYLTDLPGVPTTGSGWPQGLHVYLDTHRRLIAAAERDAEKIRSAARQSAEEYHDAALKRAAETIAAARQEAEQILATARQDAEQIVAAAEADREQVLAAARPEVLAHVDGTAAEWPAQVGQAVEFLGTWQRSLRELLGAVPKLPPLLMPDLSHAAVVGAGAAGSALATGLGNDAALRLGALRKVLLAAYPSTPADRQHGSCAWSTVLRIPQDPAFDACTVDLLLNYADPAEHLKKRPAAARTDHRSGRALPVAPAALWGAGIVPADLDGFEFVSVDDCVAWGDDAGLFRRMVVQVKYFRNASDVGFDVLPTRPLAVKFVVLCVSNWSMNRENILHVGPRPSATSDELLHWGRPDADLTLRS